MNVFTRWASYRYHLQILFGSCVFCNRTLYQYYAHTDNIALPFCPTCYQDYMTIRKGPFCELCGGRVSSEIDTCYRCRESDSQCEIYRYTIYSYNRYTARVLQCYKGLGNRMLGYYLAYELMQFIMSMNILPHSDKHMCAIIPIPANPKNTRARGFDHMAHIAKYLADMMNMKVLHCIGRYESKAQKLLDKQSRKDNMSNSLYIRSSIETMKLIRYHTILILDDIITTGATIDASIALLSQHIKNVPVKVISILRKEY